MKIEILILIYGIIAILIAQTMNTISSLYAKTYYYYYVIVFKILVDTNLYSGTLYMDLEILEKYTNIEEIYVELIEINQKNNKPPYYKKDCHNCFIKIFVLEYNKEKEIARIALIDKDNFSYKFSIINISTNNLYIENGRIKTIL